MKAKATEHSKMGDLARLLKIHRAMAIGLMERLWHWTAAEIPDGGIGKREDETIAAECYWPWPKRAAEFVDALHTVGFLDEIAGCRLYIHNWHKHCEDSVHRSLALRGLWFANGLPPKLSKLTKEQKERALPFYCTHKGNKVRPMSPQCAPWRKVGNIVRKMVPYL